MSDQGLALAQDKMTRAGVAQAAIDVFSHYYRQLEEGVTGFIPEDSIEPLTDPDLLESVEVSDDEASASLTATSSSRSGSVSGSMESSAMKPVTPSSSWR